MAYLIGEYKLLILNKLYFHGYYLTLMSLVNHTYDKSKEVNGFPKPVN